MTEDCWAPKRITYSSDTTNIVCLYSFSSNRHFCFIIRIYRKSFRAHIPSPGSFYHSRLQATVSLPQSQPGCSCLMQRRAHVCHFGILLRSGVSTKELLSHPEDAVVLFACVISPNTMTGFTGIEAHFGVVMLFLI